MLAETAALRLGTTVANAAGRLWLGGRQREQERLLPMEELVRVKVPGVRLQREVRQQFEQITNAVFDRLEPFLKHEFHALEEGGREAVINAVSDAFARADLSDDVLLNSNVNPAELVRHISGSVKSPVALNENESRLYDVLIAECVDYYVRIVRSLPVFEERAVAELLTRTATLGAEVARLLECLPDRSLLAPDGTDHDAAFHRTYMELVSRDLDEVELYRRTSEQATTPRVRLSVAYVSLRASRDDGRPRRGVRPSPSLRPDMSFWEEGVDGGSGVRVEAALQGVSRALLRGEAGSGKTTLLRWLAITAARGAFNGPLAKWNGLTPIFVKLREYSGQKPPSPEAMLDGVAGQITGIMPRGWVQRQLVNGKALLLIDGVDELLERERRVIREWLRKILSQYPETRVVVTSRPAAASADWLRHEGFKPLHLDRMTPPDMAAFVRQWHQAVRDLGVELPCAVDELPQYEQSLLVSLKDRAHLQSLAGTPLLAAMLCAMHLNRGRQLPRDRMELYRNALHTLIHDRDADRNVPSAMDSKLSLGDKLVILRDLAWRLSDNNRSEIDLDRAADYVSAKLKAMRHLDLLDGTTVLEQLRHRAGVLRSPAAGRMDFVHRTFQEYLAASEAAEEDRIGNLVGRAHLDLWRETIIMTAGHANSRQREELLNGILDRAENEPRHTRTLRLLAAACQETLPSTSEELAGRLDKTVIGLLPAKRKTDPPALAAVGPSLLRYFPSSPQNLSEKAAEQTVRTIALIGGEEALELLAGYVGDTRMNVVDALIQAWGYFDADIYADEILSRLPLQGREVRVTHSRQLSSVNRLNLTHLRLEIVARDLQFLSQVNPLLGLWIDALGYGADLTVLRNHPGLKYLMVFGLDSPSGTSALAELTELETLAIPYVEELGEHLRNASNLQLLSVSALDSRADLSTIARMASLRDLHLVASPDYRMKGLDDLAAMENLNHLTVFSCDVGDWLSNLRSAPPVLSKILFYNCALPSDLGLFSRIGSLEQVTLYDCKSESGARITKLDIPGVTVMVRNPV
ncbi:NACHT domain-containing protein [Streptomyces pseudogriseolus]|uniref:NACHT domain-containing protein n=1 Tax=Streptomyces pseudogriseolus TaxID=36817 RepID=UPI003FA2584F